MFSRSQQDIVDEIRRKGLPVVISGAGVAGQALFAFCRKAGIDVLCFCDNSIKVAGTRCCGQEIVLTSALQSMGKDFVFIVSVAAIKDAVGRLQELGYSHWYAGGLLLKDFDLSDVPFEVSRDQAVFIVETCIFCHEAYLSPDRISLRSLDVIITEKCSLRCKDCSNLMQYYDHPRHVDLALLRRSIDAVCEVMDDILEFRVIGGEAFMSRDWPVVVRWLLDEPKVRRVVVYSNATIVPSDEALAVLEHRKAIVNITDYGMLSRRLSELTAALRRHGIVYHLIKMSEWLDCSRITPHGRTAAANKELYKLCCAKNMITLSDGKLFRCPYAANAHRLSAVPDYPDDYVDLLGEAGQKLLSHKEQPRQLLRAYFSEKDCLETCDYCDSRPLSGPEVPPAVQAGKPLVYRKYS